MGYSKRVLILVLGKQFALYLYGLVGVNPNLMKSVRK
jgi:hypothetical protein